MSTTKPRTSSPRGRSRAPKRAGALVARQRKLEVLGLVLLVLAALLALAVLTRSPADDALVSERARWADVFDPRDNRVDNRLGPVGAVVARTLVTGFLGYPVLLLVATLVGWGYVLLRQRRPVWLPLLTGLAALAAVLTAALFGWFDVRAALGPTAWSGAVGFAVAGWMTSVVGAVGAVVLLALAAAVVLLLVVDRDIQATLDRLEDAVARMRTGSSEAWEEYRAGATERRAARDAALEERAERREAQQRERQLAREEAAAKRHQATETARQKETARLAAAPPATPASESVVPAREGPPARRQRDAPPEHGAPGGDGLPAEPPARPTLLPTLPSLPADPAPRAGDEPDEAEPLAADDPVLDDLVRQHRTKEPAAPAAEPAFHVVGPIEEEPAELHAARSAGPALTRESFRALYTFPPLDLLEQPDARQGVDMAEIEENKRVLLDKLETYNVQINEIDAVVGPTVTRYELTPAPGVKISRITALEDDLAMALAAPGIRIIAPIPGKSAIGVEIPNRSRELVRLRSMLATAKFRDATPREGSKPMALPVIVGKSIEGELFLEDLAKMPHLLIAGATGAGKSVGLNTLIAGLLYACHPADLKLVMVDPKKIELNAYAALLDHFIAMPEDIDEPITTDFALAAGVLRSCEREMERRYDRLAEAGVRGIKEYNAKVATGALRGDEDEPQRHRHLPYVVVVIDELADLMMTSGKEVEAPIARLAQMARAVGIHLVIATQRPSVDVITGLIKANFPSRIAYQVASRIDSRTILDQGGAHQLVGNGDLLYMNGSRITRLQGPYLSVEEIEAVVGHIKRQPGSGPYLLPPVEAGGDTVSIAGASASDDERDVMFEEAARAIVRSQQGSVSLLQRKLSIGYTRAARIVDQLEEAGIVGPFEGSKAREVLVTSEPQLDEILAAQRG